MFNWIKSKLGMCVHSWITIEDYAPFAYYQKCVKCNKQKRVSY